MASGTPLHCRLLLKTYARMAATRSDELTRVLKLAYEAKNFDATAPQQAQRSLAGGANPDDGGLNNIRGRTSPEPGTGATSVRRAPPLAVKKMVGGVAAGQPVSSPTGPTVTGVPVKENWSKSGYPTAGSAETTLRQRHSPGNSPGRISPVGSGSPRSGSPVANPSGKLKLTKAQAAPVEAPIYQRPPPPAAGSGSPPRERSPRERSPRDRLGPGPRLSPKIATVAEHVTEGDSGGVNDIASPAAGLSNTDSGVGNTGGAPLLLGSSGGESNITTKYGGYRTSGSPRTVDSNNNNTSGSGPNPMARSAQAAPVGRRLSGGRVGPGGVPAGGPGAVAFGSGSSRGFDRNSKNDGVGSRSFNSNTNNTDVGGRSLASNNSNTDVGGRSFNGRDSNTDVGGCSFNGRDSVEGGSGRNFNSSNNEGGSGAPTASRLRAGSTPSLGGGGRGEGASANQTGGRAPMAMRSMSADGGGGMADYSSSHQVGNSRATAGLGGIGEADGVADGGRTGGSGGVDGMGTGIGGRGIGGGMGGIGSGSHPVDTYSNPSTDDDEDFETPTAANTPPSSAGGVAGGFTTPPRGNSPGVNTKSSSSPGTSVSNGPDAGTGVNNINNPLPTAGTPSTSAPPSAFAPEASDKNFRAPSGRHLRAPSATTSEQNASTPFSPGKSDASSSLFSTQSGVPGGRSGSFDGGQPGNGGGGGNGMGPSSRFVQSGRAMTGIDEASLPPGAIHEEHHDHHSWNTRTQVPTSPILGEGGRPIGSHTFSAIGAGSRHEGFATDRYNSTDAGAAAPGQQGRLEGVATSPSGPQPSFPGPMASGGGGVSGGLPTERSGATNFGSQQGPVGPGMGSGVGQPAQRNGGQNFGGQQVVTGPVRHESGTRPVLNQQGVPVGSHSFSRSAVGSRSPVARDSSTRPIMGEGGAPIGSQSFTRAGAGSHSDKFAADRINTGPSIANSGPTTADYTRTGHTGDLHVLPYQPTRIPGPPHSGGGGMGGSGMPAAAMGGMNPQGQQGGQPFVHHEHHNAAAGPGSPLARFSGQQAAAPGGGGGNRPSFTPMQGMQPMQLGANGGGAQRSIGGGSGVGGMPAGGMVPGSMVPGGVQPSHRVGGVMPPALGGMGGGHAGGMDPGSSMPLQMDGGMPPMPTPTMGGMGGRGPTGAMPPAVGMGSMGSGQGMHNNGSSNSLQGSGSSSASGDGAVAEAGSRRGFSSFSSFTPIGTVAPIARSAATSS